jgi:hypothetical protein
MVTKILSAKARLDDSAAMAALLAPISNSDVLSHRLAERRPGRMQAYDRETRIARYVVTDGSIAACYTVTDLTLEQAATIAAECESISAWELVTFQAAVERALGASFGRVQ